MSFDKMQVELLRSCSSAQEIKEKADSMGMPLSDEEAEKLFEANKMEEIDADELEAVAGGCNTGIHGYCPSCNNGHLRVVMERNVVKKGYRYHCHNCDWKGMQANSEVK